MLAQNFKTANELSITPPELLALIQVLGMLERGELVDAHFADECENGFNMGVSGNCGTPACIGGWAAFLMKIDQSSYLDRYDYFHRNKNAAMHELFWNERATELPAPAAKAAMALRSYLTVGDARWDLALA